MEVRKGKKELTMRETRQKYNSDIEMESPFVSSADIRNQQKNKPVENKSTAFDYFIDWTSAIWHFIFGYGIWSFIIRTVIFAIVIKIVISFI